jgi:hypothetical protein
MTSRNPHPADDADATVEELHERAAEDYAGNAQTRNDQSKQGGGQR